MRILALEVAVRIAQFFKLLSSYCRRALFGRAQHRAPVFPGLPSCRVFALRFLLGGCPCARGFCYTGRCFFRVCGCGSRTLVHDRCGQRDPRKPRASARRSWRILEVSRTARFTDSGIPPRGREGRAQAEPQCASVGAKTRSVERSTRKRQRGRWRMSEP